MVVAPTGAGKTVIAVRMILLALARNKRVLFNAHRREIIDQTYEKLLWAGVDKSMLGVIMANDKRRNPVAPVQVASIDTIRNRANKPPADLVFVDEAHRSLAQSIVRLMEAYPNASIIGLTATPWRADNKGFEMVFDDLVLVATVKELIDLGFLAEPRVFTGPAEHVPDLSSVRTKGGDYDEKELALAMDKSALIGDIVEHWGRLAEKRKTVAFGVNITHSKHIAELARGAGIRAEHIDGEMRVTERQAILGRFDRGETEFVCNVNVLAEGWDHPPCKCLVQARPTKSIALHLQQAGRILRPWNKVVPVILDHARNAISFGLPQDEREYTLEAPSKKRRAGSSIVPVKTCPTPGCYAVLSAHVSECPLCGHVFQPEEPIPGTVDGKLVEYTIEHKRKVWEELCQKEMDTTGELNGWAFEMFKNKFKAAPPKDFRPISIKKWPEEDKRSYARWLMKRARDEVRGVRWVYAVYRGKFNEDPPLEIIRGDEGRVELAEGQEEKSGVVDWVI